MRKRVSSCSNDIDINNNDNTCSGAPRVRKYGNPSVQENLDWSLYNHTCMYVHPSMYANVTSIT